MTQRGGMGVEGSSTGRGYMYTCGWFTLLSSRNQHCKTIILQQKHKLKKKDVAAGVGGHPGGCLHQRQKVINYITNTTLSSYSFSMNNFETKQEI